MKTIKIQSYKTKIGELIFGAFESQLCLLDFKYRKMRDTVDKRLQAGLEAKFVEQEDEVLNTAIAQVNEYLAQTRTDFDIPIVTVGTDFQKNVWAALMEVPYGATSSYSELAESINSPKAIRAVASANGANALALIIPCHRIIGHDGQLVGYGGGLSVKKRLLKLEKENCTQVYGQEKVQANQQSFAF